LFFIFLLSFCAEQKLNRTQVSLPKYSLIDIDSIFTKPVFINPINMFANDNIMVVLNFGTDTIFRVFNQPECNYLGWFGKQGRGPGEFLMINSSGVRFCDNVLQIADLRKIYYLNLDNKEINNDYNSIKSISIPGDLLAFNYIFTLDSNHVCGVAQTKFSNLSIDYFNPSSNEIGSFVDYPDFGFHVPENVKRSVFSFTLDLKPDKSLFALVYSFYPLLRICDRKGDTVIESFIDGLPQQIDFKGLGTRDGNLLDGIVYYSNVKVTNRYIYLMYEPKKGERVGEHEYKMNPIGSKELHIFDWDGQPVLRVKLKKGTRSFVPSPTDEYLYCTNDYVIDKIYRYYLKDFVFQ